MTAAVITQVCPYCQKARSPRDIMRLSMATICVECYRQHEAAVLALSGLKANGNGAFTSVAPPPQECSECHLSASELSLRQGGGNLNMTVIYEAGHYRFLCRDCAATYIPKRRELFKGTAYAEKKRIF